MVERFPDFEIQEIQELKEKKIQKTKILCSGICAKYHYKSCHLINYYFLTRLSGPEY